MCNKLSLFFVFYFIHYFSEKHEKIRLFLRIGFIFVIDYTFQMINQESRPFWERNISKSLLFCNNDFGLPDASNFLFFIFFVKKARKKIIIIPVCKVLLNQ